MGPVMTAPDLARLIADAKGDRTYDQISRAAGGEPTGARLHQLATKPLKAFPGPETILALSRGLDRTVTEVVAAAARSLGLDVHLGPDAQALTLATAGQLPTEAQDAIRGVARQMLALHQAANAAEESDRDGNAPAKSRAGVSPAPLVASAGSPADADVSDVDYMLAASDDEEAAREFEGHEEQP